METPGQTPGGGERASNAVAYRNARCYRARPMGDDPTSDEQLVRAMAQGDAEALGQLYDRFAPSMIALARHLLASSGDAEDLVHDVFLEAWRHAAEFDRSRGTVRGWLTIRTRSRALDLLRSAAVSRRVATKDDIWQNLPNADAADHTLSPDANRVRRVLAELPIEQRTVLLLGYFRGLSSSEIAEHVNVPVGTVKSRVASALSKLRSALGEPQGAE